MLTSGNQLTSAGGRSVRKCRRGPTRLLVNSNLLKITGLVKHCTGYMAFLHHHYETSTLAEGHEWEHTGSLLVTQAVPCKIEHVSCPALEDSCFFFFLPHGIPSNITACCGAESTSQIYEFGVSIARSQKHLILGLRFHSPTVLKHR